MFSYIFQYPVTVYDNFRTFLPEGFVQVAKMGYNPRQNIPVQVRMPCHVNAKQVNFRCAVNPVSYLTRYEGAAI